MFWMQDDGMDIIMVEALCSPEPTSHSDETKIRIIFRRQGEQLAGSRYESTMFEGIELLREAIRLGSLKKMFLRVYEALCRVCHPISSSQLLCLLRSGLFASPNIAVPQNVTFLSSSAGSAMTGRQGLAGQSSGGSKRKAGPLLHLLC